MDSMQGHRLPIQILVHTNVSGLIDFYVERVINFHLLVHTKRRLTDGLMCRGMSPRPAPSPYKWRLIDRLLCRAIVSLSSSYPYKWRLTDGLLCRASISASIS